MAYDQNQLNTVFQQALGRLPSQAEIDFLKPYLNDNTISSQEIGQYLQGLPEAQAPRLQQQQGQYQNLLTQGNNTILGQAANAANQQFASQGRQWSSGQGNAILQAGQQLAAQQSPMIANFYAQGQQGLNSLYTANGQNALMRAYQNQDSLTNYRRMQAGYFQQQNDYNNYLNSANSQARAGGIGSLIGGALGGVGGFMAGGPIGGLIGGSAGSKAGGGLGSLFG